MINNSIKIANPSSPHRFLSLTIAKIPLSEMNRAVQRVLSRIAEGRFERSAGCLNLTRIYELDPPIGGAHPFKILLYSPNYSPETSVLITNVTDGWNSLCHLAEKEHKSYQIQIISTRSDVEFPQNRLETWMDGVSRRIIMTMRDSDDWVFFQKGLQESFEDPKFYETKIKKNRLNRGVILNYMKLAGYDLTDDSFWRTSEEAVYYEEKSKIKDAVLQLA